MLMEDASLYTYTAVAQVRPVQLLLIFLATTLAMRVLASALFVRNVVARSSLLNITVAVFGLIRHLAHLGISTPVLKTQKDPIQILVY